MLPSYTDESSPQTIQRSTSRPNMATSELFSALSASVNILHLFFISPVYLGMVRGQKAS